MSIEIVGRNPGTVYLGMDTDNPGKLLYLLNGDDTWKLLVDAAEDTENDDITNIIQDLQAQIAALEAKLQEAPQLLQITEAPPAGFGVGKGKLITGVNSDGSYTLGEEVPVVIPSLT